MQVKRKSLMENKGESTADSAEIKRLVEMFKKLDLEADAEEQKVEEAKVDAKKETDTEMEKGDPIAERAASKPWLKQLNNPKSGLRALVDKRVNGFNKYNNVYFAIHRMLVGEDIKDVTKLLGGDMLAAGILVQNAQHPKNA